MAAVRRHYNRASRETAQERRRSGHLALRRFHNALKAALFRRAGGGRPPAHVLDLACGRGGDVSKWAALGARRYTGVDIAEEALDVARQRYAHLRLDQQYLCHDMITFRSPHVHDMISIQFAMHYAGATRARLHALWAAAAAQLAPGPGARVVCTFPDARALARAALTAARRQGRENENDEDDLVVDDNPLVRLRFPAATRRALLRMAPAPAPAPAPWGLAVHWALGALVDDRVPEYILWPEHVAGAARAAGLRVVETDNFHAFAYRHGVPQDGLSENEWAVSRLYRTLVAARAS